MFHVD